MFSPAIVGKKLANKPSELTLSYHSLIPENIYTFFEYKSLICKSVSLWHLIGSWTTFVINGVIFMRGILSKFYRVLPGFGWVFLYFL